jgi:low affinity Fe/Cu permease
MKAINILITVFAFVLLTSAGTYSQNDTSRSKEKLRKVIKEKLIEKLNIDEATANKFIDIAAAQRKEMKEFMKKRKDLTDYIFDNPQSSDVGTKLEDLMDTENKLNQSRNDFYTKLKSFLTPNQIAQSMVFQKELMKFMKKEMKRNNKNDDRGDDHNGNRKDDKHKDDKRNNDRELF